MNTPVLRVAVFAALFLVSVLPAGATAPRDPLAGPPTWKPPGWTELRSQVLAWSQSSDFSAEIKEQVATRWPESKPTSVADCLDYLVQTFALADSKTAATIGALTSDTAPKTIPPVDWLADDKTPELVAKNFALYLGRWAAQQQLYDEAIEYLDNLTPEDVADPAGLLFYQAVVRQRLLKKEAALEALASLLQGADNVPRRYLAVAELMGPDLEGLEDDSLDHIARRMDDIRRRLRFGRANKTVQEIEDGVVKSLDKLIEKAERQQQQQQQAAAPSGSQSVQPASDSRILPGRGPGEVTKKDIGDGNGWGDLPPKQREAALQQIGREFPAHYRDAIEQYFKRLAGSENERE